MSLRDGLLIAEITLGGRHTISHISDPEVQFLVASVHNYMKLCSQVAGGLKRIQSRCKKGGNASVCRGEMGSNIKPDRDYEQDF